MPYKALDSSHLHALGWQSATPFREALEITYAWFLDRYSVEVA
jgi:nucleoside-diphosphate-sugar epimerase